VDYPVKSSLPEIVHALGINRFVIWDLLEKEGLQEIWFEIGFLTE
jgi:hypothetical protein